MRWWLVSLVCGVALAGCGANVCECVVELGRGGKTLACGEAACFEDGVGRRCEAASLVVEDATACGPSCVPSCGGRVCGDNGCGGSCGTCDDGSACSDGKCVATLTTCDPRSDRQCPSGERCMLAASDGPACRKNLAGRACTVGDAASCDRLAGGTGSGFLCSDAGRCEAQCEENSDCRNAERCVRVGLLSSVCRTPCDPFNGPCPAGMACNGFAQLQPGNELFLTCYPTGANVEGEACTPGGNECAPRLACIGTGSAGASACHRVCSTARPCASGQSCVAVTVGTTTTSLSVCVAPRGPCVPNPCTGANRHQCVVRDHVAACDCDAGWVDVGGTCVDATPCSPNPCTGANRHVCVPNGTQYSCQCDAGYTEVGGACLDATPCSPNPCTGANRHVCVENGTNHSCQCDAGYLEVGGVCLDATPCSPNPCTQPYKTQCTENGTQYTCGCDPGTVPTAGGGCAPSCPSGSHSDGDSLEPNECSVQTALLPATRAGSTPLATSLTIGPLSSDVDYYRVDGASSRVALVLLDADAAMCTSVTNELSYLGGATSPYRYYAEMTSAATFSCARTAAQSANPAYKLAVLQFDVDSDYPAQFSTPYSVPGSSRAIANRIDTSDSDVVKLRISGDTTFRTQGARLGVGVKVTNPANGSTLLTQSFDCLARLTPSSCFDLSGITAAVDVELTIRAQSYPNLTAYRIDW